MKLKYTSIETILSSLHRDFGKQIDEGDLIEWIGEVLEALSVNEVNLEKRVAIIQVKDFQCELPNDVESIIQIGKNEGNLFNIQAFMTVPDIVFYDRNGNMIEDTTEIADYLETYFSSNFWANNTNNNYAVVRLADSTFFNEASSYKPPVQYRYSVVTNTNLLRFNFREGEITVTFFKRLIDRNGIPMIPDHYLFKDAIKSYVIYKVCLKDFYNRVQGSEMRLDKAEKDWRLLREQARSYAILPHSIDEMEKLVKTNNTFFTMNSNYRNFFDPNSRL